MKMYRRFVVPVFLVFLIGCLLFYALMQMYLRKNIDTAIKTEQTSLNFYHKTTSKGDKNDSKHDDKPILVDVSEIFLAGGQRQILFNSPTKSRHTILWYNKPVWIPIDEFNNCLQNCTYMNCVFSTNKTSIRESSAVIFSITNGGIGKQQPLLPLDRNADQAWIFFGVETPAYLERNYKHIRPTWKNSFNWSMTYRLDSDIVTPYGYLKPRRNISPRNYSKIFRMKTKFAAWIVSNCRALSGRDEFVKQMQTQGIKIDIYGRCGKKLNSDPYKMLSAEYKFYLGFENSLCSDYITDKFFRYFNLNVVLVLRGGADYKTLLPDDTYIDTANFNSVAELVGYLKHIGSNETLYTAYLRRKDMYETVPLIETRCLSFCALCRKLNNLDAYRKSYETIPKYLETCHKPKDIYGLA